MVLLESRSKSANLKTSFLTRKFTSVIAISAKFEVPLLNQQFLMIEDPPCFLECRKADWSMAHFLQNIYQ